MDCKTCKAALPFLEWLQGRRECDDCLKAKHTKQKKEQEKRRKEAYG